MIKIIKTLLYLTSTILCVIFITGCEKDSEPVSNLNETDTTITDVDGNVYKKVIIGDQTWMAENLKTTKYLDGTEIPNVTDNTQWCEIRTPAYCWYENEPAYKDPYGAIYNWYTVQTDKLCPSGWHVSTDDDWTQLEIYLQNHGYNYNGTIDTDDDRETNNFIAKALATKTNWAFSANEGTVGNTDYPEFRNKTGFNAIPGGFRDGGDGQFKSINHELYYHTSTELVAYSSIQRQITSYTSNVIRTWGGEMNGFSVRCIKDE